MSLLEDTPSDQLRLAPIVEAQRGQLLRLLSCEPYVGAPVEARVRAARTLTADRLGGPLYGVTDRDGTLRAALLDAGALHLIGGGEPEWTALAGHLSGRARRCTSIVGRSDAVAVLWRTLAPHWSEPREIRDQQPMLVTAGPPTEADPRVRPVTMAELDAYLPAAAAMFAEELGLDATRGAGGERGYRDRIAALIAGRRAYARVDDGVVIFKADLGSCTSSTCQVQGVWVHPERRGRGVATAAMGAVIRAGLQRAPTVSLYVNDFNVPARRVYDRLGMTEVATLSTVLF